MIIKQNQVLPNLIATIQLFKIAKNVTAFQDWFNMTHHKEVDKKIFHGYKYLVEGCLHIIVDRITDNDFAGIKNDFLLNRARAEWISMNELNNTCNKIVLLKNIYSYLHPILKAKDFTQLQERMTVFEAIVILPFEKLLDKRLSGTKHRDIGHGDLQHLSVIWTLYIYFTQIANNSPVAHISFLAGTIKNNKSKFEASFEGYKYGLQYLWFCALGTRKYNQSSLVHLNESTSWKNYIYNLKQKTGDEIADMFNQTYDLEVQTCLDSYFERLKEKIIIPLEKKYKINFAQLEEQYLLQSTVRDQKYFKELLINKRGEPFEKLSSEKQIETTLYWFPIIVLDSERSSSYGGVGAFNMMLAGSIALTRRSQEFKQPIVCKFTHPIGEGCNTYTYGILVDTKSAAENYHYGWVLYYNCCNDFSGFSSSEHGAAEKLINRYRRQKKIELRELEIPEKKFANFISHYLHRDSDVSLEEHSRIKNSLLETAIKNQKTWLDIKGLLLEWIAYYVYRNKTESTDVKLNIEKKTGEIDVLVQTKTSIKLIECKVTPDNYDLLDEIKKLLKKAEKKSKELRKPYAAEFWFWHIPSKQNEKILKEHNLVYIVLSEKINSPLFNKIDLTRIRAIMQIEFESTNSFLNNK